MNTPSQWAARPAVRFAGLAAGLTLLLGACGDPAPEEKTGAVTPPAATIQLAQATIAQ